MGDPCSSKALEISNFSARYGDRRVIDDLTIAPLQSGKVTALAGPNGAGKSTLLRALAGLVSATGSARYGERDLLRESLAKRTQLVTFMPQTSFGGIMLNVLESVIVALKAAPMANGRTSAAETRERALRTLVRVGVGDLALRRLNELSGGQRQLVNLAQTIARGQEIVLLDEPTSALDLRMQMVVMTLVRELAAEGKVIIVAIHDLNLALRWTDHLIVLDDSGLRREGPPQLAISSELLAEVYGVRGRVERCSRGMPHLMIDAPVAGWDPTQ